MTGKTNPECEERLGMSLILWHCFYLLVSWGHILLHLRTLDNQCKYAFKSLPLPQNFTLGLQYFEKSDKEISMWLSHKPLKLSISKTKFDYRNSLQIFCGQFNYPTYWNLHQLRIPYLNHLPLYAIYCTLLSLKLTRFRHCSVFLGLLLETGDTVIFTWISELHFHLPLLQDKLLEITFIFIIFSTHI